MSDSRKRPRPCVGTTEAACTHGALVVTRYASRCKSCAAKQRHIDGVYPPESIAYARDSQARIRATRRGTRIGSAPKLMVPISPMCRRLIESSGFTLAEMSREVFGDSHTLRNQLTAGKVDDAALDTIAAMLSVHPMELGDWYEVVA